MLFSIIFPENLVVYELMWKNMVEADRPHENVRLICFACWISKATNTHSEYVIILIFHGNNGYTNAPYYYVLLTLPAL